MRAKPNTRPSREQACSADVVSHDRPQEPQPSRLLVKGDPLFHPPSRGDCRNFADRFDVVLFDVVHEIPKNGANGKPRAPE